MHGFIASSLRLEHGEAAAAARAVARSASVALPASRGASVAAAHRAAALAQRRAAKKREAADAEALPLHAAAPPAGALDADALACVLASLDARSLAHAACVCRAWRSAAVTADAELWRPLLRRCFAAQRRGAAATWREAFAFAAAARPAFDAPRVACRRCGALAWRADAEEAPALRRRTHAWRGVCAERAAKRTLRKHGLAGSSDSDASGSSSDGGSGASGGSDDDDGARVSRQHRLWALPRGLGGLRLS